jgi:DNA anti-recombination protein RmuC
MTIDERLERLTERHEALTQSVELLRAHGNELSERLARQAEKSDRDNTALNQTLDEYFTKLAAAQLITEEKAQRTEESLARLEQTVSRFIDSMRSGNGHT